MAQPPQPYASASLYVGDLPSEATEGVLYDLFKTVGPVASIRICRDAMTKRSLGYAYINYHDVADAERALDTLNFTPILSKPCRIMWSHRDPSKRKSGVGNIFIKNLDTSITNSVLYDTFSAFGKILSCKVEVDNNGNSKGYGFVHFETQEQADQAAEKVNGMLMVDKKVYVGPFLPRKARTAEEISTFTNIFIKNLDPEVSSDDLKAKFAEYGTVTSSVVMTDSEGKSKGFGFINFEKAEDAAKAVEQVNGAMIKDKQVYVGRAQKKQEREEEMRSQKLDQAQKFQGVNVYIKNIDDSIDDDRLRQEFSKFGTITSSAVMKDDKTGSKKGFGFVCFATPEEATRAVTEMNGVRIGSKPLYVGLAQRKDQRRQQLVALHNQKLSHMRMMNMGQPVAGGMGMGGMMPGAGAGGAGAGMHPGMLPPNAMNMNAMNMYHQGAPPVFFNGMGMPPNVHQPRGGMMGYPSQIGAPRPRFGGQGRQGQAGIPPNMNNGGMQSNGPIRGGRGGGRGGRGAATAYDQRGAQQQQGGGNFKYTSTARNQPNSSPAQQPTPAAPQASDSKPAATPAGGAPAASVDDKMMLGERIYAQAFKTNGDLAGKLTGMILEAFEITELYNFLENPALLDEKINEALAVLSAAPQQP